MNCWFEMQLKEPIGQWEKFEIWLKHTDAHPTPTTMIIMILPHFKMETDPLRTPL